MQITLELIIKKINQLTTKSKYIKLYEENPLKILRGQGKIIGDIDELHLNFLKKTNGLSLLDVCFLGFKNTRLYPANIYDEMSYLWSKDCTTTLVFWCIAGNSVGEYFGYISKRNHNREHYIAYYNENKPGNIKIVSSNFNIFIYKLLLNVEEEITRDPNILEIENYFFDSKERLVQYDPELSDYVLKNGNNLALLDLNWYN